jgi:hypothetical protein
MFILQKNSLYLGNGSILNWIFKNCIIYPSENFFNIDDSKSAFVFYLAITSEGRRFGMLKIFVIFRCVFNQVFKNPILFCKFSHSLTNIN